MTMICLELSTVMLRARDMIPRLRDGRKRDQPLNPLALLHYMYFYMTCNKSAKLWNEMIWKCNVHNLKKTKSENALEKVLQGLAC